MTTQEAGRGPGLWAHERGVGGPLVVLVHGAPDTSRSFRATVDLLPDMRTLVYDRRGWGRSVDVEPPVTALACHVDDLVGLLRGRRATVVGHSFGCVVAMATAVRRPDLVAALGLWEPPMPWADWWPDAAREAVARIADDPAVGETLIRTVLGDDAWDGMDEAARARRRAEGRTFVEEAREQLIPQFRLADIPVPCVLGAGSETWPHIRDASLRIASELGAPLKVVPRAGHFGHVSHPAGFAELVRAAAGAAVGG